MLNRLRYSYIGIILAGIAAFVPLEIMRLALPVAGLIFIFMSVSSIGLIINEGYATSRLFGIGLSVFYMADILGMYYIDLMPLNINRSFYAFFQLLSIYLLVMLFGMCIMAAIASFTKADYDKDYLIVLGCSITKEGGLRPLLKQRTNRAIHFAWEQEIATGKPAKYVPSGGKGEDEIMSEGSAMEIYLLAHGAEFDEVFPEKKSRNTYENMVYSKGIIDEMKPDAKVAFVTTNYHVLRSGILARKAGLDAQGISSNTKWYFWPNGFAREIVAILALYNNMNMVVCVLLGILSFCLYR